MHKLLINLIITVGMSLLAMLATSFYPTYYASELIITTEPKCVGKYIAVIQGEESLDKIIKKMNEEERNVVEMRNKLRENTYIIGKREDGVIKIKVKAETKEETKKISNYYAEIVHELRQLCEDKKDTLFDEELRNKLINAAEDIKRKIKEQIKKTEVTYISEQIKKYREIGRIISEVEKSEPVQISGRISPHVEEIRLDKLRVGVSTAILTSFCLVLLGGAKRSTSKNEV